MRWWRKLNDKNTPLGRAWRTAYQTFLAIFLAGLVSFLGHVQAWLGGGDPPQVAVLAQAALAAAAAALSALVSYLQNSLEERRPRSAVGRPVARDHRKEPPGSV